jgi:hypothetical protein
MRKNNKKAARALTSVINEKVCPKSKRSQEQKCKILAAKPKKAQEEMVGFGLIMVVVMVILIVFLAISINKGDREPMQSYKVEGFINAMLQYNTDCWDSRKKFLSVKDLIYQCEKEKECSGGVDSCDVLNEALSGIINASWQVGEDTPVKSYLLNISKDGGDILGIDSFEYGNKTYNSLGTSENLPRGVEIKFIVYS